MPYLAQQGNRVQPAKTFLDPFPFALADPVTWLSRGALVDGAAATAALTLRHVRSHLHVSAFGNEGSGIETLVAAYGHPPCARNLLQHHHAVSRSAVPFASHTMAFTISPLRFSTSRLPL